MWVCVRERERGGGGGKGAPPPRGAPGGHAAGLLLLLPAGCHSPAPTSTRPSFLVSAHCTKEAPGFSSMKEKGSVAYVSLAAF